MSGDLARVRDALDAAVVGHRDAKTALLLGWLARAHVLLEGPPGCGKSALATALAAAVGEPSAREWHAVGSTLQRERHGDGERIRVRRESVAYPEVLVLDDVDCSEGAGGPQLRAALEREDAPFVVATRAASTEPSPAVQALLERFAIRVRMRGLIDAWREGELRALIARTLSAGAAARVMPPDARALRARVARIPIPEAVLDAASRGLAALAGDGLARAFPRLLRAHALLRGADRVDASDLGALMALLSPASDLSEKQDSTSRHSTLAAGASPGAARETTGAGEAAGRSDALPGAARDRELPPGALPTAAPEASSVDMLVSALAGRWGLGRGERHPDAGGAPRRRRPLRDLSESVDADPAELLAYLDAESGERPAVLQRERRGATPALLILRDVSASMQGPGARWSLRLVQALVAAARAERLRVGYVEFNHVAERFTLRGRFVHRAYAALAARAAQAGCAGRTSYQAALRAALEARLPRAACDVVMISDGVPVVGDPTVQRERRLARRRGWRLHTVFVGLPPVPSILVELARETRGLAFCVAPAPRRELATAPHWSLQQARGHGR